nr:ATP-binding protein [Niveibacterium umoris]
MLCGLLAALAWVVFEDVRRRERARRTLQRLAQSLEVRVKERTAELENSNRELLAFSYSVSHDLRAPLRAINGFSHALLEDYADKFDGTGRDYLVRVARASVRMGELIDELLKLANVARQPLDVRTVDLSALASDIAADLQAAAPDRQASFNIQPAMLVDADEPLLRNVVGNLLDNAWKFTRQRESAQIRISLSDQENAQLIEIADNGVGFDMVYAGRLFQPFQQLHSGQGYAGTGIGLASARRIIERHGGKIWAESAPGEGTTVAFLLPRRAAVVRKRRSAHHS